MLAVSHELRTTEEKISVIAESARQGNPLLIIKKYANGINILQVFIIVADFEL